MALSAISELAPTVLQSKKTDDVKENGTTTAEKEQTPLEAISHGAVMPGTPISSLILPVFEVPGLFKGGASDDSITTPDI